ncbi:unnamed protein product [Ectocarpus sp. 8 AP-2014]
MLLVADFLDDNAVMLAGKLFGLQVQIVQASMTHTQWVALVDPTTSAGWWTTSLSFWRWTFRRLWPMQRRTVRRTGLPPMQRRTARRTARRTVTRPLPRRFLRQHVQCAARHGRGGRPPGARGRGERPPGARRGRGGRPPRVRGRGGRPLGRGGRMDAAGSCNHASQLAEGWSSSTQASEPAPPRETPPPPPKTRSRWPSPVCPDTRCLGGRSEQLRMKHPRPLMSGSATSAGTREEGQSRHNRWASTARRSQHVYHNRSSSRWNGPPCRH